MNVNTHDKKVRGAGGVFRRLLFLIVIAAAVSSQAVEEEQNQVRSRRGGDRTGCLGFSTYLGGSKYDSIRDVATDGQGNIYITGGTDSSNFPTTPGTYDGTHNGDSDVFVMKLDPNGKIIWSTYLGGPSHDRAYAIEVDNQGYVYIGGRAGAGFPVTAGAFQAVFQGGPGGGPYPAQDGFVAKLTPDGKKLVFASYFGAIDDPSHPVRDLAIDHNGDIFVAASTKTGAYPQAILNAFENGFQPIRPGGGDGVVAKIRSDGSQVLWATYLGGSGTEWGEGSIRVDAAGNVYYLTVTNSTDIPTTAGAFDRTFNGGWDFYLAKLTADGKLAYGTYLGGSGDEHIETHELAVDAQGNAYIGSGTTSPDFPTTPGAFQRTYGGSGGRGTGKMTNYSGDVIVAKISSDGSQLVASTFIGGRYGEAAEGVAVDHAGNVYLTGATFSDNFPVTTDAFQGSFGGRTDAFAIKLSPDFSRLIYSTYLGGSSGESGRTATANGGGNFLVGGEIDLPGNGWPARKALQPIYGGGNADAILAKFTLGPSCFR